MILKNSILLILESEFSFSFCCPEITSVLVFNCFPIKPQCGTRLSYCGEHWTDWISCVVRPKNAWYRSHSTISMPQAPSDGLRSTKQVLPKGRFPETKWVRRNTLYHSTGAHPLGWYITLVWRHFTRFFTRLRKFQCYMSLALNQHWSLTYIRLITFLRTLVRRLSRRCCNLHLRCLL